MDVLIIFLVAIAFILTKFIYDAKIRKEQILRRLEKEFGEVPQEEYTTQKFESIQYYYDTIRDDNVDIDDITWNDIGMDDIYMLVNNTSCAMGEEYLYAMLRKIKYEKDDLEKLDKLVEFFMSHKEARVKLQYQLKKMGKFERFSVYEYMNRLDSLKTESILKHVIQAIAVFVGVGLSFIRPTMGIMFTIFIIGYNFTTYFKAKARFDNYLNVVSYITRLLTSAKEIEKLKIDAIAPYVADLNDSIKEFRAFKRGSSILGGGSVAGSGNPFDVLLDYIRILFHVDIIQFYRMLNIFKQKKKQLNRIYETIGFLDSCIAVASFRQVIPYYCKPDLTKSKAAKMEINEAYHVLISNPVTSSIHEEHSVLITGSNASGKSTFIKTLAINAVLSQTIFTSLSKEYHGSYFKIASSMALRDDILSNDSYYIVEIKSLKRIFDRLDKDIPMLCFVDEVLRGTNTLERIAASSQILLSFAKANALCFAATHDIELTHILENYYSNYHFQEQIVDNNVLFDYKLYEGRAISKNAIKLLSMIGYSNDIIENATNAANDFLEKGEWKQIES